MLAVVSSVFHAPANAFVLNVLVVALAASAACFWALMRNYLHRWLFHLPLHVLACGGLFVCGIGFSGGPVVMVAALLVLLVVMSGFTETQMARVLVALGSAAVLRAFMMLTISTPGVRAGGQGGVGRVLTESSCAPSLILAIGAVALLICAGRWLVIEVVDAPKSDLMHSRLNRNIAPGVMSALAALTGCAAIAMALWFENFLWAAALGVMLVVAFLLLATLTRSVPAWFGLPLLVLSLGFFTLNLGRPADQGLVFDAEIFSRNIEAMREGAGERVTSIDSNAAEMRTMGYGVDDGAPTAGGFVSPEDRSTAPEKRAPERMESDEPATLNQAADLATTRLGLLGLAGGALFLVACAFEGLLGLWRFPPPVRTLSVGGLAGVCAALLAFFLVPANFIGGLFVVLSPLLALAALRGDFEEELEEEME